MEIMTRGLLTILHGMGFGALFMLAFSGALAELYRISAPLARGRQVAELLQSRWNLVGRDDGDDRRLAGDVVCPGPPLGQQDHCPGRGQHRRVRLARDRSAADIPAVHGSATGQVSGSSRAPTASSAWRLGNVCFP